MPKGRNAFFFFMQDWKKQEERKGRRFPNGLKDVQADPSFHAAWRNLSNQEKMIYKEKEKSNASIIKANKKTSLGESVSEIRRAELKQKEFIDNMKEDISLTVRNANENNSCQELKFYVVHINYFYSRILDRNETVYCPAEIAIAEFSLKNGVIRTYHRIVNSKIEVGFACAATEHSNTTHQIPKNPDFGESNYNVLYEEICEFLNPGRLNGKLPPIYTQYNLENVKNPVISVLDKLMQVEVAKNNTKDFITVYSLEELFLNLYNINIKNSNENLLNDTLVSMKLKEDPFNYKTSTQCEYHQTIHGGGNYCSKSLVQRWIFVLCSYCCPLLEIDLVPGLHIPRENKFSELLAESCNVLANLALTKTFYPVREASTIATNRNQIKPTSERTFVDEERRRSESMRQSIKIVQYESNPTPQHTSEALETPLRRPFTKPGSHFHDLDSISVDEQNFPSIGRGSHNGRKMLKNKSLKSGYASCFK